MNTHLFLRIVAWGLAVLSGGLTGIMALQLAVGLFTPNATIKIGLKALIAPTILIVSVAYLLAS